MSAKERVGVDHHYSMYSLLIKRLNCVDALRLFQGWTLRSVPPRIFFPRDPLINSSSQRDIRNLADQNSLC